MDENQLTGGSDDDHSSDDDLISAIKMHYPAAVVDVVQVNKPCSSLNILQDNTVIDNIDDQIIVQDCTDTDINFSFSSSQLELTIIDVNTTTADIVLNSTNTSIDSAHSNDIINNTTDVVLDGPDKSIITNLSIVNPESEEDEEEDRVDDPDYEPQQTTNNRIEDVEIPENENRVNDPVELGEIKRKRKRIADPEDWRDNKNQKLREQGKKYEGWSRKSGEKGKRGKERNEREMGPPCNSKGCEKTKLRQCKEINETEREQLFNTFWSDLSWDQKKIYIGSLVVRSEPIVSRKEDPTKSRRQNTLSYTLKKPNGKIIQVCKKLFMSTFDLGEWTLLQWASGNIDGESHGMTPSRENVVLQRRTVSQTREKRKSAGNDVLNTFLESLPKLPSHYCRQRSSKVYLEPTFQNSMADIYKEYIKVCKEHHSGPIKAVSRASFDRHVSKLNLSFQPVKKDRCDKCIMFENKNIDDAAYNEHIIQKDRARKEKEEDKRKALEGLCTVLAMDVEAVKVSPSLNASAIYYKTKLCCHNFTVLNLANQESVCYWFEETQADLSANTFASCLTDFLSQKCDLSKPIIVWSDGCTNQNRNSIMANALLSFSFEKNVQIEQKFLVIGHTQMEVDGIHSLIERKLKDKPIYLPSDFVRYTEEARQKPTPLLTKTLTYSFVKNYGERSTMVYESIRPGKKPSNSNSYSDRAMKYYDGKIQVKLSFDAEYSDLPQRVKNKCKPLSFFQALHKERLKITKRKYLHLQDLKAVIPQDCHPFYDLIPHDGNSQ